MTDEELIAGLAQGLQHTAESFLRVAVFVAELERRGKDLSRLKISMLPHLRAVASGTLSPSLLVRYHGSPLLLRRLARLPLAEQQRIVERGTVSVLIDAPDGGEAVEEIDPAGAGAGVIYQVFADDHIRTPDEQRIVRQTKRTPKTKKPTRELKAKPDHERGGVVIGKGFATRADVLVALESLSGSTDPIAGFPRDSVGVELFMTRDERDSIDRLARESGRAVSDVIRGALRSLGMI